MLPLLLAVQVVADLPKTPGLAAVAGLTGCWSAPGTVRGKDSTSIGRGEWHLGGRYFMLHLRSITKQPYEAAIVYGAGQRPEAIGSFWMDTFGGLYEPSLGLGTMNARGFTLTYRFPDALYANQFEHRGSGWHWTIVEQSAGKPDKIFAEYTLARASCRGANFRF
jgi:hypothetical protein